MALVQKIVRPKPDIISSRFGPPLEPGEMFVRMRPVEAPPPKEKKKSQRQIQEEEMARFSAGVEEKMKMMEEEQQAKLKELPF